MGVVSQPFSDVGSRRPGNADLWSSSIFSAGGWLLPAGTATPPTGAEGSSRELRNSSAGSARELAIPTVVEDAGGTSVGIKAGGSVESDFLIFMSSSIKIEWPLI